jgi:Fur family transcriptional regulator, ferric uptake regulator
VHSPAGAWADNARRALRHSGGRGGAARERVVSLLAGESCALTAAEIDRRLPQVGRASVYRALEQLEGLGLIQRLDLGGGAAGYERLGPGGEHHHHLLCRGCGRLVPFHDEELERAIGSVGRESGFRVTSHEVTLQGTCAGCQEAPRA